MRENVSSEMWERVNALHLRLASQDAEVEFTSRPHEFFRAVLEGVERFHGAAAETMTRGEGWDFMQVGLHVERATATARLLAGHFTDVDAAWGVPVPLAEYLEWSGPAAIVLRVRGLLPTAHGRTAARPRGGLPAARLPLPALDQVRVRRDLARAGVARRARAVARLRELRERGRIDVRRAGREREPAVGRARSSWRTSPRSRRAGDSLHQSLYEAYITYPVDQQLVVA